jgi:7,8-dihydropterin-6-yl-methyl-4-(beta-D-ribofuranosyl)aminobenzene 5'-phosphate synthase
MALTATAPFQAPTVESLSVRLVVDSYHDIFMPKAEHPFCRIEHVARMPGREKETFACEWGLSLHLESKAAGRRHQYLLDFGFTP